MQSHYKLKIRFWLRAGGGWSKQGQDSVARRNRSQKIIFELLPLGEGAGIGSENTCVTQCPFFCPANVAPPHRSRFALAPQRMLKIRRDDIFSCVSRIVCDEFYDRGFWWYLFSSGSIFTLSAHDRLLFEIFAQRMRHRS